MNYANFDEYYSAESPLGRAEALRKEQELLKIANAKARRLNIQMRKPVIRSRSIPVSQIQSSVPIRQEMQLVSKEQRILQELFRGEPTWGTGNNLPKVNGILIKGGGLIKNGDVYRQTGAMFGI